MRLNFEDGEREVIRARLSLAEDANDEAIAQAFAAWVQEDPQAANGDDDDDAPGGGAAGGAGGQNDDEDDDIDASQGDGVFVDIAEFRRLKKREKVAAKIEAAERVRDRDELIEEAIADGKFGPGRRQHYRDRYDSDQEGTRKLLARLAKNTVPLEARGADEPTDEVDAQAYPQDWLAPGEVAGERQQPTRASSGNGGGGRSARTRVHGED